MAAAMKNGRSATGAARSASSAPAMVAAEFLIFEDNGGDYHWTIADGAGKGLVQSPGYASYDEAQDAARVVQEGAGAARLEGLAPDDPPVDLAARRALASEGDSDAERWLDDGGGLSSLAVRQWPAAR